MGGCARCDVCYAAARDVAQLVFGLEFELSLGCGSGSGSGCLPACLMLGIFVGQQQQQQGLQQNRQQAKRAQQNMQLQEEPQKQQQQPSSSSSSQATTATTVATMASALGRVVIPSSYVLVDLLVFFVVVFFGVDPLALAICQLFGKLTAQRSLQCTHTHTQRQSHMHCIVVHSCKLMSLLVLQQLSLRCAVPCAALRAAASLLLLQMLPNI